jgi:hypothetical protein
MISDFLGALMGCYLSHKLAHQATGLLSCFAPVFCLCRQKNYPDSYRGASLAKHTKSVRD